MLPKSKIVNLLLLITLFGSARVLTTNPVEIYISYIPMVALIPLFLTRFFLPKKVLLIFLFLLLIGILSVLTNTNTVGLFFKIYLGLFFSYLFYYGVVKWYNSDIDYLFKLYLKGAVVIAIIGLFQFLSFQVNFTPGYTLNFLINKGGFTPGGDFGIRISSIFSEPTYFATFISPAFFVALHDIIQPKSKYFFKTQTAVLVIVMYFLTYSGNAYNSIFIIVLLFLLNFGIFRYALLGIPLLFFGYLYAYNNIYEFRTRVDGTIDIFKTGTFKVGVTHGSAVNLYDNYQIAISNFKESPFFGSGLGSHPITFDRFTITKHINQVGFAFNKQDANSMFLRALSETGLFGVLILVYIAFKFFVHKRDTNPKTPHLWLISNAILVLLIINYLRQGHYFLYGFPFYVWLYYFVWKKNNEQLVSSTKISEISS